MQAKTFKVGDLRALIQESSNEFKAKLGPGVKSGNETNNDKAYKDAEKRAKDYDGGLADEITVAKYEKPDDENRTTLDYEVDNVDDKYKKRIAAQAQGYTSEAERDNKIEKLGDYDDNKVIFDAIKDDADDWKERRKNAKGSGLAGRTFDKEKTFGHGDLYESNEGLEMRDMMNRFRTGLSMPTLLNEGEKEDFYAEEDSEGNTGKPGMVKSYDIGMVTIDNVQHEADELEMSLEDYLQKWWDEVGYECPWTWQELGHGYGYEGDQILRIGDVVFKDIYGQLMVDEYEPGRAAYKEDFVERLKKAQNSSSQLAGLSENRSMKTAFFKKTTFLNEEHMRSRIPDEFKVEENVFRMKDKTGNEYILEWKNGKSVVLSHKNKNGMNESIDRMKALMGYNSSDYYKKTSASDRINENEAFNDTLGKARKIIK